VQEEVGDGLYGTGAVRMTGGCSASLAYACRTLHSVYAGSPAQERSSPLMPTGRIGSYATLASGRALELCTMYTLLTITIALADTRITLPGTKVHFFNRHRPSLLNRAPHGTLAYLCMDSPLPRVSSYMFLSDPHLESKHRRSPRR
jgi:hypothetical protein